MHGATRESVSLIKMIFTFIIGQACMEWKTGKLGYPCSSEDDCDFEFTCRNGRCSERVCLSR